MLELLDSLKTPCQQGMPQSLQCFHEPWPVLGCSVMQLLDLGPASTLSNVTFPVEFRPKVLVMDAQPACHVCVQQVRERVCRIALPHPVLLRCLAAPRRPVIAACTARLTIRPPILHLHIAPGTALLIGRRVRVYNKAAAIESCLGLEGLLLCCLLLLRLQRLVLHGVVRRAGGLCG